MMKKILLLILCAAMIMSLTTVIFASESSETKVPDGYTAITTRAQLADIAKKLNGKYILMNDIDLGGSKNPWSPIGTNGKGFTGTFDGNGHVIRGLYISSGYADYQGLFGMNCGIIRSLTVQGTVSGDEYIGGIAGASVSKVGSTVLIENCRNECSVTGKGNYVGGITGLSQATTESGSVSISVVGCVNAGTVTGNAKYVGGIAGGSVAYISSSSVKTASAEANVRDCHNTAIVTGKSVVGGIVGTHQAYTVKSNTAATALAIITKCSNSRMVTSTSDACGGIAAVNDATTYNTATARVNRCVNAGTITGGGADAGGIVSRSMSETSTTKAVGKAEVYDCRNIGSVTAKNYVGGIVAYDCANSKYGTSTANISTCFSVGKISATGDNKYDGAIVGYKYIGSNVKYDSGLEKVSKADVKKCYYLSGTASKGIAYGTDTTTKLSEAECAQQINFPGFDFTNVWKMDKSRPNIRAMTATSALATISGNVVIKGDPLPGKVLSLDTSDIAPSGAEYTVEWYRSGEKIADGKTYTAQDKDLGKDLWAIIRASGNLRGSLRSATLHSRYDEITVKPVITGETYYNNTVKAGFTDSDITAEFQWYVSGKLVGTGESYTISADDIGGSLSCTAVGYGHFYGKINSENHTVSRAPITGTPKYDFVTLKYGDPISIDVSKVDNTADFTYITEWVRDDGEVRSGETLTTDEGDVGHYFRGRIIVDESLLYLGTLECEDEIMISNWSNPYTDVKYGQWYNDAVGAVTERGIFNGVAPHKFSPQTSFTRGMFVTVLSRMAGAELDNKVTTPYTDVKSGQYYTGAVKWASDNGLTNGISATLFAPNANITREQLCTLLARYADYTGAAFVMQDGLPAFDDYADISKYARESVETMHLSGIVSGRGGNKFYPRDTATRAEVATVIARYISYTEPKE